MKTSKKILAILIIACCITSCTIVSFTSQEGKLMYSNQLKEYEVVGRFLIKEKKWEILYCINLSKPKNNLDEIISKEIAKYNGDAVINLEFKYKADPSDFLISILTSNMISMRELVIKGEVIKYQN